MFLGTLGENTALLGFFLPGNSLALLGALYARLGTLQLGWVVFFAMLGTVLGYHVDYLLGASSWFMWPRDGAREACDVACVWPHGYAWDADF